MMTRRAAEGRTRASPADIVDAERAAVAKGSEMTPSFELTPSDKLAAALEALDRARRTLEDLATIATGDGEIDDAVADAAGMIEIKIAGLARPHRGCVEEAAGK